MILWLIFLYYQLKFGLILLIALAPFLIVLSETNIIVQITGIEFSRTLLRAPKDIWLLSLVVVWSMHLLHRRYQLPIKSNTIYPIYISIISFIAIALIYMFVSPDIKIGFWGLRSTLEFVIVFFLTIAILTESYYIQKAIRLFLWSGLIFSLWGFYRILTTQIGPGTWFEVMPEHIVGRLTVFGDEHSTNAYAIFMSMLVSFCLGALTLDKNKGIPSEYKSWHWLLVLTLIFAGINLIFTFSRRAWLGVVIAAICIGLLSGKKRLILRIGFIILLSLLIAYFVQPLTFTALFTRITTFDPSNITIRERLDEWATLYQRIINSNLFGVGLGVVGPIGVLYEYPEATLTHNYYLMLLTEMGILGLLIFIWILGAILWFAISLYKTIKNYQIRSFTLGLIACIIALIFSAIGGVTFENFPNSMHFWFFSGLLVSIFIMEIDIADIEHQHPN
ncbi:MAG: O-antigen ligase family protein [bacterium]|nr:O-antigen ligase family protein [bacterium]